jgi:2'-hydroxyisoflavone reductase
MAASRRVLVLGGTSWLGGRVAAAAHRRGHAVTCLARGEAGAPHEGVRFVPADRWTEHAYDPVLAEWDSVIDVSWQPELVGGAVAGLREHAGQWIYISSCSVYADDSTPDADESAPLHEPWSGTGTVPVEEYGAAKVACERLVSAGVGADRALLVRPGLIVGYGDRSDRFGYWPARFARVQAGGEVVLVPPLDAACQVVDVDDLTDWLVRCVEERTAGVMNAICDPAPLADVLDACAAVAGAEPALMPVEDAWLTEHGVQPWAGEESLPLWLPHPEYSGFMRRGNAAAKRAGLTFRSWGDSAAAALRWETELGLTRDRRAGLSAAREQELLALRQPTARLPRR